MTARMTNARYYSAIAMVTGVELLWEVIGKSLMFWRFWKLYKTKISC